MKKKDQSVHPRNQIFALTLAEMRQSGSRQWYKVFVLKPRTPKVQHEQNKAQKLQI